MQYLTTTGRQVRLTPEHNPVTGKMISVLAEDVRTNLTLGRWYSETREGWHGDGRNFTEFADWAEAVQA